MTVSNDNIFSIGTPLFLVIERILLYNDDDDDDDTSSGFLDSSNKLVIHPSTVLDLALTAAFAALSI